MTYPYYVDDWVTLYCADAREVGYAPCDAILTDPPYGIEGGSGGDARDFGKGEYGGTWADTPTYIASVVAPAVKYLASFGTPMAVTPGVRCMHLYPTARDVGCFWTPAGVTHGPWGFQTFHPIFYYGKDWRAGKGALPSGREVTESAERNGHPCPKPLGAWTWLLDKVCPPGGTVFDPFCGSGTTLRAAKNTGRKAIGVEIEERYCEIAVQRLSQEVLDFSIPRTTRGKGRVVGITQRAPLSLLEDDSGI